MENTEDIYANLKYHYGFGNGFLSEAKADAVPRSIFHDM